MIIYGILRAKTTIAYEARGSRGLRMLYDHLVFFNVSWHRAVHGPLAHFACIEVRPQRPGSNPRPGPNQDIRLAGSMCNAYILISKDRRVREAVAGDAEAISPVHVCLKSGQPFWFRPMLSGRFFTSVSFACADPRCRSLSCFYDK